MILAAAGDTPAYLTPVALLMVTAAVIGYLCVRLSIVPIVGFLLAGVLAGPNALGLIREREVLEAAADVGIILLLFTIGIQFSIDRLNKIRRVVLVGGSVQVLSAIGLTTGLLAAFGVAWRPAVFTGFLVALSSTAIVLKLLGGRGETQSPTGQAAVGLLVFQDLAVVLMVLLVPILGGQGDNGPGPILGALGTAALVIAITLVAARRVVPPLLEAVARACSPEVFLLSVIALCLGTAYLTSLAGVSVSLGAFLAGLVVSESRHSAHALGEILPLQILFSAIFFVSIGTLLDTRFLLREPLLVLGAVALVLGVKIVTTLLATRVVGLPVGTGLTLTLLLAQVGEFAFVLNTAGAGEGLSPAGLGEDGGQAFIAATVVLLVATPALAALGRTMAARSDRRRMTTAARKPQPAAPRDGHVLISGWGSTARYLAAELQAARRPFVVVTLNPDGADEAEALGYTVLRGESRRRHVLHAAGLATARMVVIGDDDAEQTEQIAGVVSTAAPGVPIVACADSPDEVAPLSEAGVTRIVLTDRSTQRSVAQAVRAALGAPPIVLPDVGTATRADITQVVRWTADPDGACAHAGEAVPVVARAMGCEECLKTGQVWVHLRLCLSCGHVGCCESSPGKHAQAHARSRVGHDVITSLEPGEDWGWCYLDDLQMARLAQHVQAPT